MNDAPSRSLEEQMADDLARWGQYEDQMEARLPWVDRVARRLITAGWKK